MAQKNKVKQKLEKLGEEVGGPKSKEVPDDMVVTPAEHKEKAKTIAQLVGETKAELNEYKTERVRAGPVQSNVHLAQASQNVYNAWQLYLEMAFDREIKGNNAPQEIEERSKQLDEIRPGAKDTRDLVHNVHLFQYEFDQPPDDVADKIQEATKGIGEQMAAELTGRKPKKSKSKAERDTTFGKGLQTGVTKSKRENEEGADFEGLI